MSEVQAYIGGDVTAYSDMSTILFGIESLVEEGNIDGLKNYVEDRILSIEKLTVTLNNIEAVTSDAFFNMLVSKGAHFGFYFHLMPIGTNAVPELMPTPKQRKYMIQRIREVRSETGEIEFFPMDFQNDGEYVGGCIAGGRNYFHINSNGDAEPCVFIHFSNCN